MGGFDVNGVNGNNFVQGTGTNFASRVIEEDSTTVNYGFEADKVGDVASFTTNPTKPAFNSFDLDQMWKMAGIEPPKVSAETKENMDFILPFLDSLDPTVVEKSWKNYLS
ncbi:MAG: hypothetical protein ACI4S3_04635 [Candidatus Gastranaerophilaceae bacterium]